MIPTKILYRYDSIPSLRLPLLRKATPVRVCQYLPMLFRAMRCSMSKLSWVCYVCGSMRCSVHTLSPSVSGSRRFISWHGLDLVPARRLSLARCLFSFSLILAPPTLTLCIATTFLFLVVRCISWSTNLSATTLHQIYRGCLVYCCLHRHHLINYSAQLRSPLVIQSIVLSTIITIEDSVHQFSLNTITHLLEAIVSILNVSHNIYHSLIACSVLTLKRHCCRQKGAFLALQSNLRLLLIKSRQSGVLQHVFWWSQGQGRWRICSQE